VRGVAMPGASLGAMLQGGHRLRAPEGRQMAVRAVVWMSMHSPAVPVHSPAVQVVQRKIALHFPKPTYL
jgi:hypothetical protein